MFIPTLANTAKATTHAVTNINVIIINFPFSLVIVKQSFYLLLSLQLFLFLFSCKGNAFCGRTQHFLMFIAVSRFFIDFRQITVFR